MNHPLHGTKHKQDSQQTEADFVDFDLKKLQKPLFAFLFLMYRMKTGGLNLYERKALDNALLNLKDLGVRRHQLRQSITALNHYGKLLNEQWRQMVADCIQQDKAMYAQIMYDYAGMTSYQIKVYVRTDCDKARQQAALEGLIQYLIGENLTQVFEKYASDVITIQRQEVPSFKSVLSFEVPKEKDLAFVYIYPQIHEDIVPKMLLQALFTLLTKCKQTPKQDSKAPAERLDDDASLAVMDFLRHSDVFVSNNQGVDVFKSGKVVGQRDITPLVAEPDLDKPLPTPNEKVGHSKPTAKKKREPSLGFFERLDKTIIELSADFDKMNSKISYFLTKYLDDKADELQEQLKHKNESTALIKKNFAKYVKHGHYLLIKSSLAVARILSFFGLFGKRTDMLSKGSVKANSKPTTHNKQAPSVLTDNKEAAISADAACPRMDTDKNNGSPDRIGNGDNGALVYRTPYAVFCWL